MGDCFYREGLRFECTRCSRCCRFDPGFVFLSYHDLDRLQKKTGMERAAFLEKYCRAVYVNGVYRLSLKEKDNYDCIFWRDGGCTVYDARPLQCSTYPFWEDNLRDAESWNRLEESCPGINKGQLHPREEIDRLLRMRKEEPVILVSPAELEILEKEPV